MSVYSYEYKYIAPTIYILCVPKYHVLFTRDTRDFVFVRKSVKAISRVQRGQNSQYTDETTTGDNVTWHNNNNNIRLLEAMKLQVLSWCHYELSVPLGIRASPKQKVYCHLPLVRPCIETLYDSKITLQIIRVTFNSPNRHREQISTSRKSSIFCLRYNRRISQQTIIHSIILF